MVLLSIFFSPISRRSGGVFVLHIHKNMQNFLQLQAHHM